MLVRITAVLVSLALLPAAAHADRRVALVVGNSAYQHTPKLANPKNDATDVSAALKALGFHVIDGFDLDKAAFDRKVRDFATALQGADAGVFFYAGHGLQVAGQNYLVPVDTELTTAAALEFEMVRVDVVHRVMERQTSTNVLFLDACRDNPLARNLARAMGTRSAEIGRGLAPLESGVGTLISFSTQPGNVALDGAGRNSPFAGALVKHMSAANDDLGAILIAVRNDVMQATQRKQVPWEHSALTGRFYFNPPVQAAPAAPQASATPAAPARLSEAAEAWDRTKDTTSIPVLEAFLARYKDTFYSELARARIEDLKKQQVAVAAPPAPATRPAEPTSEARPANKGLLPGLIDQTVGVVLPRERATEPVTNLSPSRQAVPLTAAEERALKPKNSFKECDACPEMVVIPAGEQTVGSNDSDQNERPPYTVVIAKPFAVGKFEVTFAEWDACISDNGCSQKPNDQGWGRDRRPVVDVSADHIQMQFIPWLRKKTGRDYRLLTEAEWEYSARAGTLTAYPWGNEAGRNRANCDGCADKWSKQSAPVGSFPANDFGLHDMHGNVWEIVSDCWNRNHQGASSDAASRITGDCTRRVIRGGSWYTSAKFIRSAARDSDPTSYKNTNVGFRVARTLK